MKDTFDKVVMDEERKEQMRSMLGAQKVKKSKRRTWIPALAAVAALITVLVAVPFTRNMIVSAAEALGFKKTKSGVEVSANSSVDTENSIYVFEKHIVAPDLTEGNNYAQIKYGRLFCVIDGNWTDVTDECSQTEYYRKETTDTDGDKVVIYVGGTPDCKGSIEFTYDADGMVNIVYGDVESYDAPWIESAFAKEGLNYYQDNERLIMIKDDGNVGGSFVIVRTDDIEFSDIDLGTSDVSSLIDDATATT